MKLILDIKQYLVLYDFPFVNDSIAQTVFSYALLPKSVSATVQETLNWTATAINDLWHCGYSNISFLYGYSDVSELYCGPAALRESTIWPIWL